MSNVVCRHDSHHEGSQVEGEQGLTGVGPEGFWHARGAVEHALWLGRYKGIGCQGIDKQRQGEVFIHCRRSWSLKGKHNKLNVLSCCGCDMEGDADLDLACNAMFSFDGKEFVARVVRCHDADTIRVVYNTENDGYKQLILRLYGIDAPEIRSKNLKEKKAAAKARDALLEMMLRVPVQPGMTEKEVTALLEGQCVKVKVVCKPADKYGRVMAYIYALDDVQTEHSFNDALVDNGFAYPYFGKTKQAYQA